ncbi:MAG: hypothetical protein J6V44_13855 [Methanobrevibacter sp.]|nr:hypothetical protein [Methanobrevibacter sp.]
MPKTADEMLVELRKTHTELENELRDAYVEFQNHGAAEAEFLVKKLRKLADKMEQFNNGYKEYLEA